MVSHRPACFTTTRGPATTGLGAEVVEAATDLQQFVLDDLGVLRYELAEPCDSPNVMSEDSPHAVMMPSSWSAPSIASNRPGA
jgi:hypothetical protein